MCNCKNVKIGSYDNQVELNRHASQITSDGKTVVCIDACLADEIKMLWNNGIETNGCCCVHNTRVPYIGVYTDDDALNKMDKMGYVSQYNPHEYVGCGGVTYYPLEMSNELRNE